MAHFESQENSYFCLIPNIISELGLDPYQKAVYLEFRRIAGEGGKCTMSIDTLCKRLCIGRTKLKEVKKQLSCSFNLLNGKPLIKITQRKAQDGDSDTDEIIITDIWKENIQFFNDKMHRHTTGGGSPCDTGVDRNTTDGQSQCDPKEEPIKEELSKEKEIHKEKERPSVDRPPKSDSVCFGNHVRLKKKEFEALSQEHGKELIESVIEQINDYLSSTGKKPYKDYAATIRNWIRRKNGIANSEAKNLNPQMLTGAAALAQKIEVKMTDAIRKGQIIIGYNYIEFNLGMHCDKILFTENAFKERCLNNLRKMGVTNFL